MAKYKPEDEGRYRTEIKSLIDLFEAMLEVHEHTQSTGNTEALMSINKGSIIFINRETANSERAKYREKHKNDGTHVTFLNEIKNVKIFENLKTPLFYDNGTVIRLFSKCHDYMSWMLFHLHELKTELDARDRKIKRQSINDDRYADLIRTEVEYKHLVKEKAEMEALAKSLTTKIKATQNMSFWQRFKFLWKGTAYLNKNIIRE